MNICKHIYLGLREWMKKRMADINMIHCYMFVNWPRACGHDKFVGSLYTTHLMHAYKGKLILTEKKVGHPAVCPSKMHLYEILFLMVFNRGGDISAVYQLRS